MVIVSDSRGIQTPLQLNIKYMKEKPRGHKVVLVMERRSYWEKYKYAGLWTFKHVGAVAPKGPWLLWNGNDFYSIAKISSSWCISNKGMKKKLPY